MTDADFRFLPNTAADVNAIANQFPGAVFAFRQMFPTIVWVFANRASARVCTEHGGRFELSSNDGWRRVALEHVTSH